MKASLSVVTSHNGYAPTPGLAANLQLNIRYRKQWQERSLLFSPPVQFSEAAVGLCGKQEVRQDGLFFCQDSVEGKTM